MQTSSKLRKVIVTGANKGIGYSIVKGLYAEQGRYHIVLTSRDLQRGEDAYKKIQQEVPNSNNKIDVRQLEVNDTKSVDDFVTWVKDSLKGVDVLINNAGYGYNQHSPEEALITLRTNFFSVVELTEKILPILAKDGKIIQISSGAGNLKNQGEQIKEKFSSPNLSRQEIMSLADDLLQRTKEAKESEVGWSDKPYHNSKCILNAYTRWVLAKILLKGDQQCFSCTPGYCRTDMTSPDAPRSADEGARVAIFLTKLPFERDKKYHGQFFRDDHTESYD